MRFSLIDRIIELQPGEQIGAIKGVSLAEEYLADHFPKFPVLPGVMMLEAMTQAGAWLVRASEDFAHSIITLKEARNIKYADFVAPGRTLQLSAEILDQDERTTTLKTQGIIDDHVAVSARLILERYNLRDDDPRQTTTDERVVRSMRELFATLYRDTDDNATF